MSWLLAVLGGIADVVQWAIGYGQRQIGKQEQQNVDLAATNKTLESELDIANQPVSATDELRRNDF